MTAPAFLVDALVLERAAAHAVHVLDLWMVGEEGCRRLIEEARSAADLVLIEGVMGLYDGTPSSADLARAFDLPVLAVIDVSAMAQTVGAVARGLRDFGPVRLAGVIANGIASEGHAAMVSAALRASSISRRQPSSPTIHRSSTCTACAAARSSTSASRKSAPVLNTRTRLPRRK